MSRKQKLNCFNKSDETGHRRNVFWFCILGAAIGFFIMFTYWEFGTDTQDSESITVEQWKEKKEIEKLKKARIKCEERNKTTIDDLCNPCDIADLTTKCSMHCFYDFGADYNSSSYNKTKGCEAQYWKGKDYFNVTKG